MKIIENEDCNVDFAGRCPVCTVKGSELEKIHSYLFSKYQGYKFAIVFTTEGSEYDTPENPSEYRANVYYLDELLEELAYYIGVKETKERLNNI